MSELSEIRDMVHRVQTTMETHISDTLRYRIERDKIIDAHSDALWNKNGEVGALTKIDRLEQTENTRKWAVRSIAGAVGTIILDKFFHIFPK